jgi:hypothetical protein
MAEAPPQRSSSSHLPHTTYSSSSATQNQPPPAPSLSSRRVVSTPSSLPPGPVTRARRQAAGGFLLDNGSGSRKHSLDPSERDTSLYQPSVVGTDAGVETVDIDSAAMVELVLSEAQKRKRESSSTRRQQQQQPGNTLSVPGSSHSGSHRESGKGRAMSPTRSFLIPGRSASSAGVSTKRYMPSSPPQQPTSPRRPSFPTPVLSSLPFGAADSQSKKRWSLGRDQLRELQREYKFSEATLQRTLKAKQSLELSAVFKKLLEIEEMRAEKLAALQGQRNPVDRKIFEYNPLRVIRNRKIRSRKKIQLDVSPWEDPGTVEQWVEDAAVSVYSPAGVEASGLPPPPPGVGRKLKRPKMDWIIEPEEILADYYWMRCEDHKREGRKSAMSMESSDKQRISLEVPDTDFGYRSSDGDISGRVSTETPRKRRTRAGAKDYHHFLRDGFESTGTSSDENGYSDSEYLNYSSDTDEPNHVEPVAPDEPHHHRRRNKLERMIRGGSHGKKKNKKLKRHELELEERRRKQEAEDMDWIASETDEERSVTVINDQPEYRKSMDVDEEYESAPTGKSPSKLAGKLAMGYSYTFGNGSKGSLERYPTPTGLGISGGAAADRPDFVVPSIAISLSPPRMRSEESDMKDDDKRDSRVSPTKKLLSGMRREASIKEKDFVEDSGRESLDIERSHRKTPEKEQGSKLGRVKSRVDKLRNVSRVEDLWPWKRGDGTTRSPTASSFTASDDEDRNALAKEGSVFAPELEDHELSKRGSGVGVSTIKKPKLLRHGSTFSISHRDRFFRKSLDSDRSVSPEHRESKLKEPSLIPPIARERSPAENVKFDSSRRKPEDYPKGLQPPSQQYIDAPEEPIKQSSPQLSLQSSSTVSVRDLHRARASLVASGILVRNINASAPPVFNPRLRTINHKGNYIESLLGNYNQKHSHFITATAPRYHSHLNRVNKSVSHSLTPMVRNIADEADCLSTRVTNELTLNVKKLQDEIFTLARRRKGRGKMRLVKKLLWGSLEWMVVVLMWVVWSVFLVFRIVRGVVGWGVRIIRWVLFL